MAEHDNSYKSIIKGTSIFGGVQILNILISLVRGKFVAMLLGPEGMGISALFTNSANSIQRLASLGLNLAIVKEVAADSDSPEKLSGILPAIRRSITLTALAGALLCVLFSRLLSEITFGNPDMAWQFVILGIAVGLTVAFNGNLSIPQGLHSVKRLSMASVVGGLTGLFVGIPLYYFFGTKGIVPAMVALALSMWIFSTISVRKEVSFPVGKFCRKDHLPVARRLVSLGILLMANDLILAIVQYAISIYVNAFGSADTLGLYQAANSVTNQYSGMVFAAMAMDYFPRLSKEASDNVRMREIVNRQTEIVSAIIAPAVCLLIMTSPILIELLLSKEFMPVTSLMRWMGIGILFRALMFPMAYISFAKGNKKLFFWLEGVTCNLLTLLLSLVFFHFYGLAGLGYALVADNVLCLAIYYFVNRHFYGYRFGRKTILSMVIAISLVSVNFAFSFITITTTPIFFMSMWTFIALIISVLLIKKKLKSS